MLNHHKNDRTSPRGLIAENSAGPASGDLFELYPSPLEVSSKLPVSSSVDAAQI